MATYSTRGNTAVTVPGGTAGCEAGWAPETESVLRWPRLQYKQSCLLSHMTLTDPMVLEESELGKEVMWKFWPAASGESQHRTLGFLSKAIESVTENYSLFEK